MIFTRKWLRIYLYSGLKGLDINRWYVGVVRDKILTRIIRECRHEAGLPPETKPTASELEMAWVFHSGIFYYGVRKYIYESPVLEDKEQMISNALDAFLAGFERVFGTRNAGYGARAGQGSRRATSDWHNAGRIRRACGTDYNFAISARYQSPISLAVISATPSWPMT